MKRNFLSAIIMLLVSWSVALAQQPYASTAEDIALAEILFADLNSDAGRKTGPELLVRAALAQLGQDYVANTQEGPEEKLRIHLTRTDCILFVDNTLALVRTVQQYRAGATFEHLAELLEPMRYDDARRAEGFAPYATRVHYVTEWIARGEAQGVFRNLSDELGGEADPRPVSFMSAHPDSYAPLSGESDYAKRNRRDISRMEAFVNTLPRSVVPRERIAAAEGEIRSGDILCFATSIDALDYSHVVIAYRAKAGDPLTFIHASSSARKVIVEPRPLRDYLQAYSKISGITVLRLNK